MSRRWVFALLLSSHSLTASEEVVDEGFLALETSAGYNTYSTSNYFRAPLWFIAGSADRDIAARVLVLSDIVHASDYFSGDNKFLRTGGLYHYSFGVLDIDYVNWRGSRWALGLGGGLGHQGFLIEAASKSAHAVVGRIRGQALWYFTAFLGVQLVVTKPFAFWQSATEGFNLWHNEFNIIFDFKGNVPNPQSQAFMFSISLFHDYLAIAHSVRSYAQHEFTPMIKVTILY